MMIPTWVFLAVPMVLAYGIGTIIDSVKDRRERRMLHYIFDGDRLQAERCNKIIMRRERKFY